MNRWRYRTQTVCNTGQQLGQTGVEGRDGGGTSRGGVVHPAVVHLDVGGTYRAHIPHPFIIDVKLGALLGDVAGITLTANDHELLS